MYDDDGSDEPSDNSMHTEDNKTYQDKKITQSVMWSLNLDKGQCILKCTLMKYCLGVQILPSVPTCYGIRERFENTVAPTVPEQGIVMYRPSKRMYIEIINRGSYTSFTK